MYSQAIVIDNGSGTCKAGIAGEKGPTACFPPIVGKQVRRQQEDVYIGEEAQAKRKELQLSFPIERGHIDGSSWRDMEKIWHHCFSNELKIKPEEHPVLLTEARMNLATRERMIQIMFETFNVPSFCLATPAALSLIACGRSTGIVLDSGYGVTYTVPIFEGKSLPDAIMSIDWAGKDLTEYLMQLLNESGYFFSNPEREIANEIKEKFCYVAKDFDSELKSGKEIDYTLPDGQGITIESQAFRCPEVLFQPAKYGQEYLGIHELTFQSIKKCGEEIREHLYGNVVLSGGSTMFEGMSERLGKEVTALAPSNTKVNVVVPEERRFSSWVGGSIVSSLSSFQDKWITKADFDESGPGVVHEKAL